MIKRLPLVILAIFALVSSISCKKAIEKKVQDMIMDAITNGEWIVEQYMEGSNNISSQFLNYSFKFDSNGTVTGKINGTATSGTWTTNVSEYTITSEFPGAGDPLQKLNGVWKIKDSDWDYVKAQKTLADGSINVLILRKKE